MKVVSGENIPTAASWYFAEGSAGETVLFAPVSRRWLSFLLTFSLIFPVGGCAKRWDALSTEEKALLHRILTHWERWVPEKKKEGKAPLITFEELYAGLGPREREFLDRVRAIDPRKSFGFSSTRLEGGSPAEGIRFKLLKGQWIRRGTRKEKLDPQYLPKEVYPAYKAMMKAMKKELGKKLLVESGYRSPAYQLYTFLYYLPKHRYSLRETAGWVALPGYSEHGAPERQAVDFINEEGVNGEDNVEEFERLPEYGWLLAHAREFGFELSYPRGGKEVTFEPWHWRYIRSKKGG